MAIQTDRLPHLMRWTDFAAEFPGIFPTDHSVRHFIRTRKDKLIDADLMVDSSMGMLVDGERLRERLLDYLNK